MKKIVVDIYGADAGAAVVVRGVAKAMQTDPIFPVLVGDETIIRDIMDEHHIPDTAYEVIHTEDYITNDEPATCVFGGRDTSSAVLALERLKKDDDCVAMLSAGNTGALLVGSICRLGLVPPIKFPSLCSALPCAGEQLVCLVDCGAAIDCTANDLVRFAKMGQVFSQCYCGIETPRVGLMSVGREDAKGSALTLEAFQKIRELDLCFVGNLEGSDLVSGYADVVVTDGFSGNLLLKSTEAAGQKAMEIALSLCGDQPALADAIREALIQRFDFNSRGAATFLGTKKTVVKMHGCANEDTTVASIRQILRLEGSGFSQKIAQALIGG